MEDTSLTNDVCTKQNCVVSAGSYLYVFGEPPETRKYVVKAERYDTVDKKWEEIADMLEERGDAFGEATQDKIVVAGESIGIKTQCCKIVRFTISQQMNGNPQEA